MSVTHTVFGASALVLGVALSGCGSSATTTSSAPEPTTAVASSAQNTASTTPASAGMAGAALPTRPSAYGQLLIDAWGKGDRRTAGRVATASAVGTLFARKPVPNLVNYSCEETRPVVCGWIGSQDARVELSLDAAKVSKGATQAVTQVRFQQP